VRSTIEIDGGVYEEMYRRLLDQIGMMIRMYDGKGI
jgi:hypothetical protein